MKVSHANSEKSDTLLNAQVVSCTGNLLKSPEGLITYIFKFMSNITLNLAQNAHDLLRSYLTSICHQRRRLLKWLPTNRTWYTTWQYIVTFTVPYLYFENADESSYLHLYFCWWHRLIRRTGEPQRSFPTASRSFIGLGKWIEIVKNKRQWAEMFTPT